jgi:hypothetical protein
MKLPLSIVYLVTFLFSCKKENNDNNAYSESIYTIEVTGKWSSPDFTVPAGVHFTAFVGLVHNSDTYLWRNGNLSSPGVESVAETGSTTLIRSEIDSIIFNKMAISLVLMNAPSATGSNTTTIYCNNKYSFVSFLSMIAPSPDWFIGLDGINLYRNNQWISDTTINLFVYDAGTEDGDVFGYNNPATLPQANIRLLTTANGMVLANGNNPLKSIASVRIRRN